MRFRQVHLDFHTSECIHDIGSRFSKINFQEKLRLGHVNSVTVFSKCHHGWSYHPSEYNDMHPGLTFDLLGEMIAAAHEIDVAAPIYLSAGPDEKLARRHPEWLIRNREDVPGLGFLEPCFHHFCMNTPYLDLLINQVEEVLKKYDGDGIFLDIVGVRKCYCQYCLGDMLRKGLDPLCEEDVWKQGEDTYAGYVERMRAAVDAIKPGHPVFHNAGHITRGRRDLVHANTHLELESLPTGGWGYDHFPLSARYVQQLNMDFLGMTGKFHSSWGEFGGYKHPNALRYETALSLANGAKCSIGDQLHPDGELEEATYRLIGAAYEEVEQKEAWCEQVESVADVGLLSLEAYKAKLYPHRAQERTGGSDTGAIRILLEGKILFDVIDMESDFGKYRVIILPDDIRITRGLKEKLNAFIHRGGKLLASGQSAMNNEGTSFELDFGIRWLSENLYRPNYFRPLTGLMSIGSTSFVMYSQSQRVACTEGTVLGDMENPYFNRGPFAFCSHQHTPNKKEPAGLGMAEGKSGIYIAWPVFKEYAEKGSLVLKEMVLLALRRLLERPMLETGLPAQGIAVLQHQKEKHRYILHLLYASPIRRGEKIEVIEDVVPIYNIEVVLRLPVWAKRIYLAPQQKEMDYKQEQGELKFILPILDCHQMVVIDI
ncbi:MAG: hypothetical protein K0R57_1842 [Paenibacillaceae bacterium]|jgi:hypothetical protein|nr:hypothetical protein [Paenibacillaceae bacterium]